MPVERKHTQHIEYLPYGEPSEASSRTLLKIRQSSEQTFFERRSYWNTPYKFNAKELDSETGMYYYGARYYTPEVSIWLSVDPLSDEYPSTSPYMYVLGNPIGLIDPNGMNLEEPPYTGGIQMFEVAYTNGDVPFGTSRSGESFTVGDYTVLPNYIANDNGEEVLSHYTASVSINKDPSNEYKHSVRVDWIFGSDDLQNFKENVELYEAAANLAYGGRTQLFDWQIDIINGNFVAGYTGFLIDQWTDPIQLINLVPTPIKSSGSNVKNSANPKTSSNTTKTNVKGNSNSWVQFNREMGKGAFTKQKFGSSTNATKARKAAYSEWKKHQ